MHTLFLCTHWSSRGMQGIGSSACIQSPVEEYRGWEVVPVYRVQSRNAGDGK